MVLEFHASAGMTLGVEIELQIIDVKSNDLSPRVAELNRRFV